MRTLEEFLTFFQGENLIEDGDFKITRMKGGGFSEVFKLEFSEERKYIVKRRKEGGRRKVNSLTFTKEKELIELLVAKIDKPGIIFVPPLICSDKIAIYTYIDGNAPTKTDLDGFIYPLETLNSAYKASKKENPLQWDHVHLDIFSYLSHRFQFDNFILSKDGTLYFIDPFAYVN